MFSKKDTNTSKNQHQQSVQLKPKDETPKVVNTIQCQYGDAQNKTTPSSNISSNKNGLPRQLQSGLESMSGYDMSSVKVHYNSSEPAKMGALAFAQGSHIHLGQGQEKHLPHESWHVVQQMQGRVAATKQYKGLHINDNPSLEHEADIMGDRASALGTSSYSVNTSLNNPIISNPVAQGKFGFELEIPILLSSQYQSKTGELSYGPPAATDYPRCASSPDGYHVHIDHSSRLNEITTTEKKDKGNAPIIELVTDPLDEFECSEDDVRTLMGHMETLVNNISADTTGFTHRRALNNSLASAASHLFVGSEHEAAAGAQSTTAYLQSTYAIKTSRIPIAFRAHAQTNIVKDQASAMIRAADYSSEICNDLFEKYKSKKNKEGTRSTRWFKNSFNIHQRTSLAGVEGLIALLCNYLLMSKDAARDGQLNKNKIGLFFYKSALSNVQKTLSASNRTLLQKRSGKIAKRILAKTGRTGGSSVLPGLVSCEAWLKEVLEGKRDSVFTRLKNQYENQSGELAPEKVGPRGRGRRGKGVVMENRRGGKATTQKPQGLMAEIQARGGSALKGIPPSQWADRAVQIYKALRELNGRAAPEIDEVRDALTGE